MASLAVSLTVRSEFGGARLIRTIYELNMPLYKQITLKLNCAK